ncbi:polyphosphate kinase 2 family protein [bacterium]|nr:polyphosphate kinase 2 family protein [bacterium]
MADLKELIRKSKKLAEPYCIEKGKGFRLKEIDPADTGNMEKDDKEKAKEALETGVEALSELQEMLYEQDSWSVLLIFQAMDAAGKDSAIEHVMSGVNPQGCQVASFKAPSSEELDHDFLWRCQRHLPERGRIGIFNRSYYEEVLIVRVHPELLAKQKVPKKLLGDNVWKRRYRYIRAFERYLSSNGIVILKFFLYVSRKEQKQRFLARLEDPEKHWKFSAADVKERSFWKDYMKAYERMIQNTATKNAPWYVVPADNKWYTRIVVASAIIKTLGALDLHYPKIPEENLKDLAAAKKALLAEK